MSDEVVPERLSVEHAPADFRTATVEQLQKALDVITVLELACLYALDNSLTFLILRNTVHNTFIPKPASISANPQIAPVLLANLVCFIGHLFAAREGGYIHGGIVIDVVGEIAPISRCRLLLADALVTALQLIMLALAWEKDRKKEQNVEAEEAGVRTSSEVHVLEEGTELRDLSARDSDRPMTGSHPTDKFYTSDHIVVELDFMGSLKQLRSSSRLAVSVSVDEGGFIGSMISRMAQRS